MNNHSQTISKNSLGLSTSISGLAMSMTPAGRATCLFVEIRSPFLLASVFLLSLSWMRFKNYFLQVESRRCSTLT